MPASDRPAESEPALPAPESMSYEDALEELERLIEQIDEGEIGLEQSLAARRRGEALIKRCRAVLDAAEQELEQAVPEAEMAVDDEADGS